LRQLVEAELLYQRGVPPQTTYLFKHALVQDTAYQSLLKSKRQQYHQQIAQALTERFPETVETQPALLAYHYTEAGLITQAIPNWQRAGERAVQRSANTEAINHLTKGLELLQTLPDSPERIQQELTLQLALGTPLNVTRGFASSELAKVFTRARQLSQQVGETSRLGPVLYGLFAFYLGRAELPTARELGEQLLALAHRIQDPGTSLMSRFVMAVTLLKQGDFGKAREHAEQGMSLYDRYREQRAVWWAHHFAVGCLDFLGRVLWLLGYPEQARRRTQEALTLAQEMALPLTQAEALSYAAWFHQALGERQAAAERAAALVTLCTEQGFLLWQASGTIVRGWALAEQGDEEGMAQLEQGLADYRDTGAELMVPESLALLAAGYKSRDQVQEGLQVVAEALARVDRTGGREWEAELHRLKGTLTLQSRVQSPKTQAEEEAEGCFHRAIAIAR
jgi:predicted ATPase